MDGSWIYYYICYILGRAPRKMKTLLDFCENMDLDKLDTTVWYRVTQNPQELWGLTGCQRDPQVLGRHRVIFLHLYFSLFFTFYFDSLFYFFSIIFY